MPAIPDIKGGTRVQHRGWFWYGTTEKDSTNLSSLSYIDVRRDGSNKTESVWISSLILDTNDFVYDWSDDVEAPKRKTKGKGKKRKQKR